MISYPALINQLTSKVEAFTTEETSMEASVESANQTALAEEQKEVDLMTERAGAEYRCLTNATCGNLHYQQCCASGSETFKKPVSKWSECADHCETKIKEGHQIVGCEILYIHGDDRNGDGICFAQTTCELKPAASGSSQCAASLCKVMPPASI